jgi:hypothetical protein
MGSIQDNFVTEDFMVNAKIRLLNKYIRQSQVAVSAMRPIYIGHREERRLDGFKIQVTGEPEHVSRFRRFLRDADLKIG